MGVLRCWLLVHLCRVEKFCSVNYVNYIVTIAQQRFHHYLSLQWINVQKFSVLCRCSLRNCFLYTLCLSTSLYGLYRALTLYLTKPLNKQFMFFPPVCIHFGFHEIFTRTKNSSFFFLHLPAVIYSTTRTVEYVQFLCSPSRLARSLTEHVVNDFEAKTILDLCLVGFACSRSSNQIRNRKMYILWKFTLHNFTFVMQSAFNQFTRISNHRRHFRVKW